MERRKKKKKKGQRARDRQKYRQELREICQKQQQQKTCLPTHRFFVDVQLIPHSVRSVRHKLQTLLQGCIQWLRLEGVRVGYGMYGVRSWPAVVPDQTQVHCAWLHMPCGCSRLSFTEAVHSVWQLIGVCLNRLTSLKSKVKAVFGKIQLSLKASHRQIVCESFLIRQLSGKTFWRANC